MDRLLAALRDMAPARAILLTGLSILIAFCADYLRQYLTQARQEVASRLLEHLYPVDPEYVRILSCGCQPSEPSMKTFCPLTSISTCVCADHRGRQATVPSKWWMCFTKRKGCVFRLILSCDSLRLWWADLALGCSLSTIPGSGAHRRRRRRADGEDASAHGRKRAILAGARWEALSWTAYDDGSQNYVLRRRRLAREAGLRLVLAVCQDILTRDTWHSGRICESMREC
jgi:hypothetical protein